MRDGDPRGRVREPGAEQRAYARLLGWGSAGGLALLVVAFLVYVTEALPPLIDVVQLPRVWTLSAREIAAQEGHPAGWQWLSLLHHGDIVNLLGIALLASCSILPLMAVAALYWRGRERVYALVAAVQVLVLVLAASGLVTIGH
jgi:hypothetical protein